GTNTYTVVCQETLESLIIDAPGDPDAVIRMLKGTLPRYILLTHNHPDHIGSLAELHSRLAVPLAAHAADAVGLAVQPDILLNDGDTLDLGKLKVRVLHTPGHTPGGLCFHIGDYLLAGDTIFPGGPGKTWMPDDFKEIIISITGKIFRLPEDTLILPGHGENTTVAKARAEYDGFASRPHGDDLCGDVLWASA
ncbi:MAG: MBL fold metallo-hydrolase, partial [Dehalococcoidales bacterium]|nr:MBL fold metallo-hydrolase [Dehalococcoidales bacterium]